MSCGRAWLPQSGVGTLMEKPLPRRSLPGPERRRGNEPSLFSLPLDDYAYPEHPGLQQQAVAVVCWH
jgi:hypothetical protein